MSSRPWTRAAAAVVGLLGFGTVPVGSTAKEYCREHIARYKTPEYVGFVEEYPMTASGKIQKYKLREPAAERPNPATVGGA
jgi:acyl-CoA synthetase (AMP-forming)/AMP-acid ligase II